MTGAILGGASVQQASKLQMIIMFMISASTVLASIFTTLVVVFVTVDGQHRMRSDRIQEGKHPIWRMSTWRLEGLREKVLLGCKKVYNSLRGRGAKEESEDEDRQGLIS